jgi:prepilin-type processing-associated H-X9-DG protein/prepilin-type N-terminal cleavage/methylation domain-containing protein
MQIQVFDRTPGCCPEAARGLLTGRRRGLTVLELLVSVSIIAILAGLLLPAVGAARESARRVQCVDHLREVGLALHSHHNSQRTLPTGWRFDPSGDTAYGWAVPILPFLGEPALSDRIDRKSKVGDPRHDDVRVTAIEVLLCPSDIADPTFELFADHDGDEISLDVGSGAVPTLLIELPTANYVGVFGTIEPDDEIPAPIGDGAFLENHETRFRDFGRGLSQTIVVGERTMAQVPSTWFGVDLAGEDAAARVVGSTLEGINNPLADECDFSSRHPGGANFLWGDGHVSFVSEQIDLRLYHEWPRLRKLTH